MFKAKPTVANTQSAVAWLHEVRLFADLHAEAGAIDHIAALVNVGEYRSGAHIINEGDEGSDAFFLSSGRIKVLKSIGGGESFPVAVLEAKDHPFFGEAALLQNDKRSATIIAEIDCSCFVLNRARFEQFCSEYPKWALPVVLRIARVVLDRLSKTNNDMILLYNALLSEIRG